MKKIIYHIRNQSAENRKHILRIFSVICAVVLIFLWIYSLGIRVSDKDNQAKIKNDFKPFTTLKENMIGGYQSLSQ